MSLGRRRAALLLFLAATLAACGGQEKADSAAGAAPQPLVAPAGNALFADRSEESGLDFVHWNGMSGELYYAEMMGAGVALFDVDGDGDLDLFLVQGSMLGDKGEQEARFPPSAKRSDRLYRNDLSRGEDGKNTVHWVDITPETISRERGYGMGVAAADLDNDGLIDLYVTNFGANQHWRNRGDGNFDDVTSKAARIGSWSVPAAVLDFDHDGWLDLFVGNYLDWSIAADKKCTDELGQRNYCGPLAYKGLPDTLLRNRGGQFEDWSGRVGILADYGGALGAVADDFDDDGWPDVYVANDGQPNQLWMNQGGQRFENRAVLAGAAVNRRGQAEASMGIAAADYDNDGDEDLISAHLSKETNTVYRNEGDATFEDRAAETGLGPPSFEMTTFGLGFLDLDNDGLLDLMTVNGAVKVIKKLALAGDPFPLHQKNQLFHNQGNGTFVEISQQGGQAFELSEVSRGAAFGDLDNDGDTDVVIVNNSGRARYLSNEKGQDHAWLGLSLVDESLKRDAIGAKAELETAAGQKLVRRVNPTQSYASTSDARLLFGLGDDTPLKLTITWPDGKEESFAIPPLRQYTKLIRGKGLPA